MTAALVSGRMPSRPLIARDTVMKETPALAATSLIVARRPSRPGFFDVARPIPSGLIDLFGARKPFSFPAAVFSNVTTGSSIQVARGAGQKWSRRERRDRGVDFDLR